MQRLVTVDLRDMGESIRDGRNRLVLLQKVDDVAAVSVGEVIPSIQFLINLNVDSVSWRRGLS